ncbi:Glucuronyltransferas-like protein [Emiliania huxleyi CCMP1516]|uniref:Glycosyltransferase 2-like domain-containing protein n=2 Tax=Emiliania huxleyi TaxID=2903 RepID=A0A0D3J0C1_EMIH1|nr:Glucuronyltransferas-like protein [Emiliania huxleyi CCMP1516]EOD16956.1 Glucuronyltransferas-like protein [Emiliania huxleyi CCMP1516]|eukprot:XP_005769385.1 Glucuronyltransferas-like protein [Emiliania huxleyi CCMP1516]
MLSSIRQRERLDAGDGANSRNGFRHRRFDEYRTAGLGRPAPHAGAARGDWDSMRDTPIGAPAAMTAGFERTVRTWVVSASSRWSCMGPPLHGEQVAGHRRLPGPGPGGDCHLDPWGVFELSMAEAHRVARWGPGRPSVSGAAVCLERCLRCANCRFVAVWADGRGATAPVGSANDGHSSCFWFGASVCERANASNALDRGAGAVLGAPLPTGGSLAPAPPDASSGKAAVPPEPSRSPQKGIDCSGASKPKLCEWRRRWRRGGAPPFAAPSACGWHAGSPRLIVVTATYPHSAQAAKLSLCASVLAGEAEALWIVVEDAANASAAASAVLASSGLAYFHLAVGPSRAGGNLQRAAALELIREKRLHGVVYQMDDDNQYDRRLWPALRSLSAGRVGVLAVQISEGRINPAVLEGPIYDLDGRLHELRASWCGSSWTALQLGGRYFCIDMGGFAFDAALIHARAGPLWPYRGRPHRPGYATGWTNRGGETEFIEALLPDGFPEDLQPLGRCGAEMLVFHNGLHVTPKKLVLKSWWRRPGREGVCGDSGWG